MKDMSREKEIEVAIATIEEFLIYKNLGLNIEKYNNKNVISVYDNKTKKSYVLKLEGGVLELC